MRTISKRWLLVSALVVVVVGGAAVRAPHAATASSPSDILTFVARLDSSQPVAGSSSTAMGTATLQIDTVTKTMTTDAQWSGLTEPADRAHVHSGYEGDPAGSWMFHEVIDGPSVENEVLPSLVDCGDGYVGCAPTTGSLHDVLDITNGYDNCENYDGNPIPDPFQCVVDHAVPNGFFIDMHTGDYPGGEIRGQFELVPSKVVGFLPTASKSTWKPGRTVPIKFSLTDPYGANISDTFAVGLLSPTCRVKFSASGAQTVNPVCVTYDALTKQFQYNWKLGKAAGAETVTVTVSYPGTDYTITNSASAVIG